MVGYCWTTSIIEPRPSFDHAHHFLITRIHAMELRLDTPQKFLHPSYETLTWFAARDLLDELKGRPCGVT